MPLMVLLGGKASCTNGSRGPLVPLLLPQYQVWVNDGLNRRARVSMSSAADSYRRPDRLPRVASRSLSRPSGNKVASEIRPTPMMRIAIKISVRVIPDRARTSRAIIATP